MRKNESNYLLVLLIILFCIFHICYIWYYSVNFGYQDDYMFVYFANAISESGVGIVGFLKELFKVTNDHILAVPRMVVSLDYLITGHLNFKFYILVANLSLLGALYMLYKIFKRTNLPLQYFAPIPFLLLQPQMYEDTLWALSGLQHIFILLFVVSVMYLISNGKKSGLLIAVALGLLGTFTGGNGIFIFPAALFILLLQRRWLESALWIVAMSCSFGLYLWVKGSESTAVFTWSLYPIFESLCSFLGYNAAVIFTHNKVFSIALGLVFLLFSISIIGIHIKGFFQGKINGKERLTLLGILCFLLITALVIAIARSKDGIVMASRFGVYASLTTCVIYLLIIQIFKNKLTNVYACFAIIGSVMFCALAYYNDTKMIDNRKNRLLAEIFYSKHHDVMIGIPKNPITNADVFMKPAFKKGIWRLSDYWDKMEPMLLNASNGLGNLENHKFTQEILSTRVDKRTNAFQNMEMALNNDDISFVKIGIGESIYLVLKPDTSNVPLLAATIQNVHLRRDVLLKGKYYRQGFKTILNSEEILKGNYRLGYLIMKGKNAQLKFCTSKLIVNEKGFTFLPNS